MFGRQTKPEQGGAEAGKADTAVLPAVQELGEKMALTSGRKPSERFMRKPLRARSRASQSERTWVANLVGELEKKTEHELKANEETKFKGYRPGHAWPPG